MLSPPALGMVANVSPPAFCSVRTVSLPAFWTVVSTSLPNFSTVRQTPGRNLPISAWSGGGKGGKGASGENGSGPDAQSGTQMDSPGQLPSNGLRGTVHCSRSPDGHANAGAVYIRIAKIEARTRITFLSRFLR